MTEKNEIEQVAERIMRLDPIQSSLEHWKFDGEDEADGQQTKEYFGEFCTPDQIAGLQALAVAYTKAVTVLKMANIEMVEPIKGNGDGQFNL